MASCFAPLADCARLHLSITRGNYWVQDMEKIESFTPYGTFGFGALRLVDTFRDLFLASLSRSSSAFLLGGGPGKDPSMIFGFVTLGELWFGR